MEPTWIYHPTEPAQIIDLAPGAPPPEGWSRSPAVVLDPNRATADALTVAVTGRSFALHYEGETAAAPAPAPAVDPDALAAALAEIERLKGIIDAGMKENEDLVSEVTKAEELLEAAAAEVATLKAALDKALADGADAANARDEAVAAADRLSAELADAHRALDAATAPKAPTKAK